MKHVSVVMKRSIIWDITQRSALGGYRRFEETFRLRLQWQRKPPYEEPRMKKLAMLVS
jgi:hypothetical protein